MAARVGRLNLAAILAEPARIVEQALKAWLDDPAVPATLAEAMRYVSLDGGKRLRPALVILSARAVAEPAQWLADPAVPAAAIEMVHCYSLVHDDLPTMDDDVLRRGRATAHVKFGEAMAILTGDALLTRAFEILARGVAHPAATAGLVAELALAAGPAGMIAGQVADMGLCALPDGAARIEYIHLRKTAAMVRAACRMGGICAGADARQLDALGAFGEKIGLAFQINDDLLDVTASAGALGKTPGKDAQAGKQTYADLPTSKARALADRLTQEAIDALAPWGERCDTLKDLAGLLNERDR